MAKLLLIIPTSFMEVCGVNSVFEALKAGRVSKIYYSDEKGIEKVLRIAKEKKIPCYRRKMREKVCAEVSPISFESVDAIAKKAIAENSFILILDNVNDPQNLGACIRTAEFFGCAGVIIKRRRAVGITEGVVRASAGAVFHVKIASEENLANVVKKLKKLGLFAIAAELDGEDIRGIKVDMPCALVIGGEDKGVSKAVKKLCDEIVRIPGVGKVGSLNLSVACGIVMFEVFKAKQLENP
ncbi:MAG: 23S rRNA (guanosine(2251)-2'-O)-methyltransferase RlmB [Archaeoglobaceae archaeon]